MGDCIHPRAKIHLINDLPHIYEVEDMIEFCKEYEKLYICGTAKNQEYLLKFFDMCGINIDGYVVSNPKEQNLQYWRKISIFAIDDIIKQKNIGIIMAITDKNYRYFIPKFRKAGFSDYFLMTEYNKRTIAEQLMPRPKNEMTFEINIADHCNLSCQCCDHYSQLSEKNFVDMDVFERDMRRMGEIFEHEIACITLLGGEPTLHKDLIRCMEITRREFPNAQIIILTNGVLLLKLENSPKGNIWKSIKDNNVNIIVTVYPIKLDYEAIEQKAKEYGIPLWLSSNIHADKLTKVVKITDKHRMDLHGKVARHYCLNCLYFNKFNTLKNGRYYMCPVQAHSNIFNDRFNQNLKLTDKDSLDIYKVKDWREFAEFAANWVPFCRYCDIKNWGPYSEWKASTKQIEEYV
jgi:organic radical activating enzyme